MEHELDAVGPQSTDRLFRLWLDHPTSDATIDENNPMYTNDHSSHQLATYGYGFSVTGDPPYCFEITVKKKASANDVSNYESNDSFLLYNGQVRGDYGADIPANQIDTSHWPSDAYIYTTYGGHVSTWSAAFTQSEVNDNSIPGATAGFGYLLRNFVSGTVDAYVDAIYVTVYSGTVLTINVNDSVSVVEDVTLAPCRHDHADHQRKRRHHGHRVRHRSDHAQSLRLRRHQRS